MNDQQNEQARNRRALEGVTLEHVGDGKFVVHLPDDTVSPAVYVTSTANPALDAMMVHSTEDVETYRQYLDATSSKPSPDDPFGGPLIEL